MALTVVPLSETARRVQPVVPAADRVLTVRGELAAVVPALQRGSVVAVADAPGAGTTTLTFELAAAATATGEWAAAVDLNGTLGGLAAAAAGVALERLAVVQRVPPARWATVVAALLDGVALVIAEVPRQVRASDARRLLARARERSAVLVAVGPWPVEAALRLRAEGVAWRAGPVGLECGTRHVRVERHGIAIAV